MTLAGCNIVMCVVWNILFCYVTNKPVLFVPDRKWVAYSKLYQSLEVDSYVLFQQLTSIEYHWHQQELPYQQVCLTPNSTISQYQLGSTVASYQEGSAVKENKHRSVKAV